MTSAPEIGRIPQPSSAPKGANHPTARGRPARNRRPARAGGMLSGMPVTSNVAWDTRLEAFKGRDTTHFVAMVAATARTCVACRLPLQPEEPLSLIVEITEAIDGDGNGRLTFDTRVCHRRCREPGLTLHQGAVAPDELTTRGALLVLDHPDGSGTRTVPVLAYTLIPVVTFREPGGELTSAHISALLSHGFELSLSTGYTGIVQDSPDVNTSVSCTVTGQGLVRLRIDGEVMYRQQLNSADAGDTEWFEAAVREGKVLVISGDYLEFTDTGLSMEAAARLGTLATGYVPFRT